MKDFTPYGIILGIVVIFGIVTAERLYLNKIFNEMEDEVATAEGIFLSGNCLESSKEVQKIISKWEKRKDFMEILLNHEEVDKISESLIEINNKLIFFMSSYNVSANFALLKEYIINIKEANEFTISNVL